MMGVTAHLWSLAGRDREQFVSVPPVQRASATTIGTMSTSGASRQRHFDRRAVGMGRRSGAARSVPTPRQPTTNRGMSGVHARP